MVELDRSSTPVPAGGGRADITRRDWLLTAALTYAGVGAAAAMWPLIAHMNHAADVRPPERTPVDLTGIAVGNWRMVGVRGIPVLVRHRRIEEVEAARIIKPVRDHLARNENLSLVAEADDRHRALPGDARFLVVVAVCSRLDCVVRPLEGTIWNQDGVALFCPCCASRYDLSGRIMSGPAPENLRVPRYRQEGMRLEIG